MQVHAGSILILAFHDIVLGKGDVLEAWDGPFCGWPIPVSSDPALDLSAQQTTTRLVSSTGIVYPIYRRLVHLVGPAVPLPFGVRTSRNAVCVKLTYGSGGIGLVMLPPVVFRMDWWAQGAPYF